MPFLEPATVDTMTCTMYSLSLVRLVRSHERKSEFTVTAVETHSVHVSACASEALTLFTSIVLNFTLLDASGLIKDCVVRDESLLTVQRDFIPHHLGTGFLGFCNFSSGSF